MIVTAKGKAASIDFGAINKTAKLRNIDFALQAHEGSMFMHRDFGWSPPVAETLSPDTESATAGEITELLIDSIENIEVGEIDFAVDNSDSKNIMYPIVEVELLDDEQI